MKNSSEKVLVSNKLIKATTAANLPVSPTTAIATRSNSDGAVLGVSVVNPDENLSVGQEVQKMLITLVIILLAIFIIGAIAYKIRKSRDDS